MTCPVVIDLIVEQAPQISSIVIDSTNMPTVIEMTNTRGMIVDESKITILKGDTGELPDFVADPVAYYILAKS